MRFDNEIQVCERTVARLQDDRGRSAVRCSREHYLWVASVILGVEKIVGDRGALGSCPTPVRCYLDNKCRKGDTVQRALDVMKARGENHG